MVSWTTTRSSRSRCSALTTTAAVVLLVAVAGLLPTGARASAMRPVASAAQTLIAANNDNDDGAVAPVGRHRRDVPVTLDAGAAAAAAVAASSPDVVREKRTLKLLKLKPLIVLPAKVALGAGAKLVAGAKLGAKAVHVGTKALGAGLVGLKAVSKVAKVTVKAATALGVKAVLLNFLFQKINQVIDFKTRLLSNLDQRNKQQNAQFLSPVLPQSPKPFGSVGNKNEFVPIPPPAGFETSDAPNFAASGQPPSGFVPGSNLVASSPGYDPQGFPSTQSPGIGPQGFSSSTQSPGFGPQGFAGAQSQGFGPQGFLGPNQEPGYSSAFAASNDDGSPSSETSF